MRTIALAVAIAAWILPSPSLAANDPLTTCVTSKLKVSSKYAACRLKIDADIADDGGTPDYSKCEYSFYNKYVSAEAKAGAGNCPTERDVLDVQSFLDACDTSVAATVATGTPLPLDPVTCTNELLDCDSALATCPDDLTACNAALQGCNASLSAVTNSLSTCSTNLSSTNADLTGCNSSLSEATTELSNCNSDLSTCETNLSTTNADLMNCSSTLSAIAAALSTCNTDLAALSAELAAAHACGNGTIDPGEDCDFGTLNGQECTTIAGGYDGGTLQCGAGCLFDTAFCTGSSDPRNYDIMFTLGTSSAAVSSLQFDINYAAATGGFQGSGSTVSCTKQVATALFAPNDVEATRTLTLGLVDLNGFSAPKDVAKCTFNGDAGNPPVPGDFILTIVDSTNSDGDPVTSTVTTTVTVAP